MFRLAKEREGSARDLDQLRCIKDKAGQVLVGETDIKLRWQRYFSRLLNEGGDGDIELGELKHSKEYRDYRLCITKEKVKEVIRKMRKGRVVGSDEIPIEVWRCLGDEGIDWLTKLFNIILRTARILDEWRVSTLIPLYKNKDDIQSCNNY